MRILKVRVQNINSLKGNWSINFEDPAYTYLRSAAQRARANRHCLTPSALRFTAVRHAWVT